MFTNLFDRGRATFFAAYDPLIETISKLAHFGRDVVENLVFTGLNLADTAFEIVRQALHFFAHSFSRCAVIAAFNRAQTLIETAGNTIYLCAYTFKTARGALLACGDARLQIVDSLGHLPHRFRRGACGGFYLARHVLTGSLDALAHLRGQTFKPRLELGTQCVCLLFAPLGCEGLNALIK